MTDQEINARIAEILAKPTATEAEVRELLSYYSDDELREIQVKVRDRIKSIERKKKHFDEYWQCKDLLKWAQQEESSRPMTSDFLDRVFNLNKR